jgi:hypothetical protein
MIIKRFSATRVLHTNAPGFIRGRKYDTDLSRLSRGDTKRELSTQIEKLNYSKELGKAKKEAKKELRKSENISREMQKIKSELNNGRTGKWLHTD